MVKRLMSFALTTGLSTVVGLVAVPIIIAGAGPELWGIQAAVQTAATLFGVFVAFGWGTTGAAEIAGLTPDRRPQEYLNSLVSRAYLLVLVYPVMVVVMGALNPQHLVLVAVGSAAFLMPFVGASWYFIGEARPARLFWLDGFPQTLGIAVSVGVMLLSRDLVAVLATQLIFNACAVVASARHIIRTSTKRLHVDLGVREAFRRLRHQRHAVATSATAGLYVSMPLLILNAVTPSTLSLYAMGDKLFRFGLTAFAPILQLIQGWLPEGGPENLRHRIIQAARLTPVIALAGGAAIALLGPWAASFLSAHRIDFGLSLSVPFGIAFSAVAITQVIGLACLVQLHATRALARSTLVGALCGLPLIVVGAVTTGSVGVAWALAVSELAVLVYQYGAMARRLRDRLSQLQAAPPR
jgi:O-antigen/teichoic acid export membrane protein